MITDRMDFSEIRSDLLKDVPEVTSFLKKNLPKYAKFCQRQKIKNQHFHYEKIESKNHNLYLIVFFQINSMIQYSILNYFENSFGFNLCRIFIRDLEKGVENFVFYTGHFFTRYRERLNIDKKMDSISLVKILEKENPHPSMDKVNDTDVYLVLNNGFGLGEFIESDTLLIKTFISNEMLKNDQFHSKITSDLKTEIVKQLAKIAHDKI